MANGRLARSIISTASTNTLVYTVPNGYYSVLNILAVNSSPGSVQCRIAVSTQTNNSPISSEYIEYNVTIPAVNGVLERTAIVCSPGEKIIVWVNAANAVTIRINGYEESLN